MAIIDNFISLPQEYTVLRSNERHITIHWQEGGTVEKRALSEPARESLVREQNYARSFEHIEDRPGMKLPTMRAEYCDNGQVQSLYMPYYPWEMRSDLLFWYKDSEKVKQYFDQIIRLTGALRTQYDDTLGTLKKDTLKRLAKYTLPLVQYSVRKKVTSVISWTEQKIDFQDIMRGLQVAWATLFRFPYFSEEYKIHGCLNLSHIRRDTDGSLVPIDFEHGANYPRRLKYQDEAYLFQNILQEIVSDETVARQFLETWLLSIGYENNEVERTHAHMALCEKLLGGIYELLTEKPDGYEQEIKKHIDWLLHFWKTGSFL